jgi:quercetin dioxygenase-like cupin family protein
MGRSSRVLAGLLWTIAATGCAQPPDPPAAEAQAAEFRITPEAETIVASLPAQPLYWRVETFPSLAQAEAAKGPYALAAEARGEAWLLTLGPSGGAAPGGRKRAEIGPVPIVEANRYLLRVNRAGGPPGARTPVHTHPGSEAFYVLTGELSQRTSEGVSRLKAGQAMNGHEPGMVMQLASSGKDELDQLVLFVVDADKPFSSPAAFD